MVTNLPPANFSSPLLLYKPQTDVGQPSRPHPQLSLLLLLHFLSLSQVFFLLQFPSAGDSVESRGENNSFLVYFPSSLYNGPTRRTHSTLNMMQYWSFVACKIIIMHEKNYSALNMMLSILWSFKGKTILFLSTSFFFIRWTDQANPQYSECDEIQRANNFFLFYNPFFCGMYNVQTYT